MMARTTVPWRYGGLGADAINTAGHSIDLVRSGHFGYLLKDRRVLAVLAWLRVRQRSG